MWDEGRGPDWLIHNYPKLCSDWAVITACSWDWVILDALTAIVRLIVSTVKNAVTPRRYSAFLFSVCTSGLLQFVSRKERNVIFFIVGKNRWCIRVFPVDAQLILLNQFVYDFLPAFRLCIAVIKHILNLPELSFNAEVEVSKKPCVITLFYFHFVLNPYFVLLEGFFMYLNKVVNSLLWFGMSCSEVGTDKAETCLEDTDSKYNCTLITELSTHTCFDGILLKWFNWMLPCVSHEHHQH